MIATYIVDDSSQVYKVQTWEDGAKIETHLGRVVEAFDQSNHTIVKRFIGDDYEPLETLTPAEGQSIYEDEFRQLINSRIEYWKTEGSVV